MCNNDISVKSILEAEDDRILGFVSEIGNLFFKYRPTPKIAFMVLSDNLTRKPKKNRKVKKFILRGRK